MINQLKSSNKIHNRILFETEDFLVTSALGGFEIGWVLVWPKRSAMSFFDLEEGGFPHKSVLKNIFSPEVAETAIWFEHGSRVRGQSIGCGVDYAHIHVLVAPSFDLETMKGQVIKETNDRWINTDSVYNYKNIGNGYHIFGQGQKSLMAFNTTDLGSQFFRRIIAGIKGNKNTWNYKKYPFKNICASTVNFIEQHENKIFRL